jgi:hypothetical protein
MDVTCPNTSWGLNDAGTACIPTDALVTCGSSQVTITVSVDHLYADLDSTYYSSATIEFGTCSGISTPDGSGFITETFDIDSCGGDWSQSGNILVDFEVKGAEAAISTTVGGETILLTSVLSFDAHCEYSSSTTLTTSHSVDEDDVTAEEVEDTTGTFDDQFTLDWFSAGTRTSSDKTTPTLGDTVYLRAASTLSIDHKFFLNTCSASQGDKSISLLDYCNQDASIVSALALVNPAVMSAAPFDWSFTAFAIAEEDLALDIECVVNICATDSSGDPLDASCGVC